MYKGCSGGGGENETNVDWIFLLFLFFVLGGVATFLLRVHVGVDGSVFFGVGGRKCCVIFVF